MRTKTLNFMGRKLKIFQLAKNEELLADLEKQVDEITSSVYEFRGQKVVIIPNSDPKYFLEYYEKLEIKLSEPYAENGFSRYCTAQEVGQIIFDVHTTLLRHIKKIKSLNKLLKIQLGYFSFHAKGFYKTIRSILRYHLKQMNDESEKALFFIESFSDLNFNIIHYEKSGKGLLH